MVLLGKEARLDDKGKLVSSRSGEVTTLESSPNFQMGAEREAREGQGEARVLFPTVATEFFPNKFCITHLKCSQ
mgnify:CR=1 FL=1